MQIEKIAALLELAKIELEYAAGDLSVVSRQRDATMISVLASITNALRAVQDAREKLRTIETTDGRPNVDRRLG